MASNFKHTSSPIYHFRIIFRVLHILIVDLFSTYVEDLLLYSDLYKEYTALRSRVFLLNQIIAFVKQIADTIRSDRLSIYAAQASFFVIISAVPFLSLLFSLAGIFLPDIPSDFAHRFPLPEKLFSFLSHIIEELSGAPNVSLLSLSAVTTLWSASRGISAIRAGIETVYHSGRNPGYVRHRLLSIFATLVFIIMIVAAVALLLFGDFLADTLGGVLGDWFEDVFLSLRTPLFIAAMSVIFTAFYSSVAQRSTFVRHSVILHIPGALFSSCGWIVFSFFYSLYIAHFPDAGTIYGSLAAICLIMLWLYFCMVILLLGAEFNKLWFAGLTRLELPKISRHTNKRR